MGANVTYTVYGYKLVDAEAEVSALTATEAKEVAEEECLLVHTYDAVLKEYD